MSTAATQLQEDLNHIAGDVFNHAIEVRSLEIKGTEIVVTYVVRSADDAVETLSHSWSGTLDERGRVPSADERALIDAIAEHTDDTYGG